jgi:amino acid adenylation domain-containing protein
MTDASVDPPSPAASARVVEIAPAEQRFGLSRWQRGLALLMAAKPQSGAQHLIFSAEITVDDPAFPAQARAWLNSMLQRHPVLRSGIAFDSLFFQKVVRGHARPVLLEVDAQGIDDDALRSRARADCRVPFDFASGCLWRIHSYRRAPDTWLICIAMHHAAFDFWSLGLLLAEFTKTFGALEAAPVVLDGTSFLYDTEGGSERQPLGAGDAKAAFSTSTGFWLKYLADAPALHPLPLSFVRAPSISDPGAGVVLSLNRTTADTARALGRELGLTPFFLFLSLWALFLSRVGGQADWVVACPASQRATRETRTQIGQFVNILPFRLQFANLQADVRTCLVENKNRLVDVLRHQDITLHRLVELLSPPRSALHAPLAQIGFAWERIPLMAQFEAFFLPCDATGELAGQGFTARPFHVPQQEGQFELALEMGGELPDGGLIAQLKYRTDLFSKEQIEIWASAFTVFVEAAVMQPAAAVASVPLADPPQRARWLALGRGPRTVPEAPSILPAIVTQLSTRSAAPALQDETDALSYGQAAQRMASLSRALRAAGVKSGDRIGVCLPRGVNWPIAALAIWSVGGVYLPLDANFPVQRLTAIVDDARPVLLIEHGATSGVLGRLDCHVPVLDLSTLSLNEGDAAELDTAASCSTAYLLYTSGSTGKPKGVQITHAALLNLIDALQKRIGFSATDRWLSVTTPAFDISLLEMLMPLYTGAFVYLTSYREASEPASLTQRLQEHRIDVMQATPTHWRMLVDTGWQGAASLKVLCGGEALSKPLHSALLDKVATVWNMYGPTETTIWSSAVELQSADPIHLGSPLNNTDFVVLDACEQPLPPGAVGQLWIGGAGLASAYWQRPDLTERQFKTVAAAPELGRLYATGDLVRWNASGLLEYCGRIDDQIKLHGYRVELGEVESGLHALPGVRRAAALLLKEPEPMRLVAFFEGDDGILQNWRELLRERLPAYMLPSQLMRIAQWPLTANGKLDRRQLAALVPSLQAESETAATRQPRSADELYISQAFSDVLGVNSVPLTGNFFELGGHSLQAVQLITLLNRRFDTPWQSSILLESPTVESLAVRLRQHRQAGERGAVPATLRAVTLNKGFAGVRPLWLFHPIGGTVFGYAELARRLDGRRPMRAFEAASLQNDDLAEVSVEALAARYVTHIVERQPQGPYMLGGWCFGGVIAYEAARQLVAAGHPIDGVVLIDTRAPVLDNHPSRSEDIDLLNWFAQDLARPHGKTFVDLASRVADLSGDEAIAYVYQEAIAMQLLEPGTGIDALRRAFNTFLAHCIALQTYLPDLRPEEPIDALLIKADDEPTNFGEQLGWEQIIPSSRLRLYHCPGDHYTVMINQNAQQVAEVIDDVLPVTESVGFAATMPMPGA